MNHKVEIPQAYLLILAARGKMGDGELPRFMQLWAEKECERLGLRQQMLEEKNRLYQETKARAAAILGSQTIEDVERSVRKVIGKLNEV